MQGLRPALSQVTPRQEGRGRIKPKADPFRGYASRDQGHTPPCREALTSSTSRPLTREPLINVRVVGLSVGAPRTGGRLLYGSDVSLGCCLVRVLSVGLASSRASSQALVRAQRCARPVGVKRRRSLAVRREIS